MSFIISPYNSIRFAKRDSLLPNFDNRLHSEMVHAGLTPICYYQKVVKGNEITIQIRTDYDSVTAEIINESNISTPITVVLKNSYTSFSTYEFTYTFSTEGLFRLKVYGTDSSQDSVIFESEPIYVQNEHPNTLLIECWNNSNTEYMDYSTGIKHTIRVESRIPYNEDDTDENIYDNQNKKTKTYSATAFVAEFITGAIPEYLVRQIVLAQGLFNFWVNDKQYTVSGISVERFGNSVMKQVNLKCIEVNIPGVNSIDLESGTIITEEMQNTYPLNLVGVSGNQQLIVTASYMPDNLMFVLKTGSSATVKAGITIGGDEITIPKTINTANPVLTIDREYLGKLTQYGNAFNIYFTITGVAATVDINLIIKKYK